MVSVLKVNVAILCRQHSRGCGQKALTGAGCEPDLPRAEVVQRQAHTDLELHIVPRHLPFAVEDHEVVSHRA